MSVYMYANIYTKYLLIINHKAIYLKNSLTLIYFYDLINMKAICILMRWMYLFLDKKKTNLSLN